ncbi:PE domain-containing protein, partial [Klebsiella pneumoniae]|nr:PE domain-containing protein [Klebsiella pneumoniae]
MQPEAVLASAAAESAISAETEAAAAGAAPALLSTTPMGGDPDSAMFSAALNDTTTKILAQIHRPS